MPTIRISNDGVMEIDLREHIALNYVMWLEEQCMELMGNMYWIPLAGMG